ncbi:MAG: hypothetical protein SOU51_03615 [Collinsella sp.]|nr:hypothetical protein [Collinsella sp.]
MRIRRSIPALAVALLVVSVAGASLLASCDREGGMGEGALRESADRMEGLGGIPLGKARGSSPDRFLADLDRWEGGAGEEGSVSARWESGGGLVSAAEDILAAYRSNGSFELVSSGYLDMFGNAWGAIVCDGDRRVDLVLVTTDEADADSVVRVVRLLSR